MEMGAMPVTRAIKDHLTGYRFDVSNYLPVESFRREPLVSTPPNPRSDETVPANLVGTAVDYLVRYVCTGDAGVWGFALDAAQGLDMNGALAGDDSSWNEAYPKSGNREAARDLISQVEQTLGDGTIKAALRLAVYETVGRAGSAAWCDPAVLRISKKTIENVRAMVEASRAWVEADGGIAVQGVRVKSDREVWFGNKHMPVIGDIDFATPNTLCDMKVSKEQPTSREVSQILAYYVMGMHGAMRGVCAGADCAVFAGIKRLAFINPRLGFAYVLDAFDVDAYAFKHIECALGWEPADVVTISGLRYVWSRYVDLFGDRELFGYGLVGKTNDGAVVYDLDELNVARHAFTDAEERYTSALESVAAEEEREPVMPLRLKRARERAESRRLTADRARKRLDAAYERVLAAWSSLDSEIEVARRARLHEAAESRARSRARREARRAATSGGE